MTATKTTYVYGLGRRKAATARARLFKGKGELTINDKPALEYLSGNKTYLAEITDPLALTGKQKDFDITVRVSGGGLAGQVDAIKLAISKALTTEFPDLRPVLKKAGFVKRDPREKERKKYLHALKKSPLGGFFYVQISIRRNSSNKRLVLLRSFGHNLCQKDCFFRHRRRSCFPIQQCYFLYRRSRWTSHNFQSH